MIIYSEQEGIINPMGIKLNGQHDKSIVLPEVAVGVFSFHLFEHIINNHPELNPTYAGYLTCANMDRNIYKIDYKGTKITFFIAGVGGPLLAGDIEDLSLHGVKKFIIFGNCGVLDKSIADCSIIIPTKAFRDEGTSQHYVPDSELIDVNPKYITLFEEVLRDFDMPHTKGYTWTTDAIYRETPEKKDFYKQKGAVCVEMEASTIAAVTQRKHLDHFTFYYAGDNLDAEEWDARSISGLAEFDKKKVVPFLAFELATKI